MERFVNSPAIRVLVVEDNRLLREGLTGSINKQDDVHVAATLGACDDVVATVHCLQLNLVLLNTRLADHNALVTIKSGCPDAKLIVMDLLPDQSDVFSFIQGGVSGFLMKDVTLDECLATIRSVASGMKVLPPAMTGPLFSAIFDQTVRRNESFLRAAVQLTKREREIVELITEGLSNKAIADRLNVAIFTVKSHVHNVLEKLALRSRLQLASYCTHAKKKLTCSHLLGK